MATPTNVLGIGKPLANLLGIVNSLTNYSGGINNFLQILHVFRRLRIPYHPLPEGIDYPPEQLEEGVR